MRATGDGAGLLEFVWYRGEKRVCSGSNCHSAATLQCITCLKLHLPIHSSYFCSQKCFKQAWKEYHRIHMEHYQPMQNVSWNVRKTISTTCILHVKMSCYVVLENIPLLFINRRYMYAFV